ncbi:MAG TPA: right-handed parallel beta-helix repeat-containing protein [Tahibacter sp.]|uniref:right-handed parallel beta-helix repeat-containing protein n=1 Tax=Tahibacter sp. TaxID=2056211 RepID=UPI002C9A59DF|nr:right-handed parallel beta-helix repeat-containing protein [Tahibacter sp.]HSX60760.1 right-handed parallel beta-helix repeat-containing protein [Tahibacter sp.]
MKHRILAGFVGLLPFAVLAAQDLQAGAKKPEVEKIAGIEKTSICAGNDDTIALQAMLNHGNPEMTVVEIPATPTGCKISGPLIVRSNTHVIQNGLLLLSGYVWPVGGATQRGMYTLEDGTHDVIIEGTGTLDGGHANYTQLASGCCMGGIVSGGPAIADYSVDVRDITIRGLTIRRIPQWPLELDGASNVLVDGVTAHDSVNTTAIGHGSEDVIVNNLRVFNIADVCFAFYRGVENAIISNSIVNQCNGGGISVFSDWPACVGGPQFSKNVVINNNIARGQNATAGVGGIDALGLHTDGTTNESTSFTFNLAHSHNSQGIGMTPARHGLIAGNMTSGQGPNNYAAGVNLLGAKGVLVSGNSTFNEGVGTTTGLGLNVGTFPASAAIPLPICNSSVPALPAVTTERVSILDNYYYDSAPTPSMLHALVSNVAVPAVVAGNTYAPMIGVSDSIIYGTGSHNADNDAQP